MKKILLLVALAVCVSGTPQVLLAQNTTPNPDFSNPQPTPDPDFSNPQPTPNALVNTGGLTNPLKSTSIQGFFLAILDILLVFALPIIVLFIMYAGFLYVTAQGDPTKIKTAHSALTWSVVGGVIVLGAKLIIDVIQNTVNAL